MSAASPSLTDYSGDRGLEALAGTQPSKVTGWSGEVEQFRDIEVTGEKVLFEEALGSWKCISAFVDF